MARSGKAGVAATEEGARDAGVAADETPRARLARLYAECVVRSDCVGEIDRLYVARIPENREDYREVGAELGIPWWFVGIIHALESSFDFGCHLHNGDPRSPDAPSRCPRGGPRRESRPSLGMRAPSTRSAVRASRAAATGRSGRPSIDSDGTTASATAVADFHRSPYVWSFSGHYEKGKYVADGRFDPKAVSRQCGGATLVRRLEDRGLIDTGRPFDGDTGAVAASERDTGPPSPAVSPAHRGPVAARPDEGGARFPPSFAEYARAELDFPGEVVRGRRGAAGSRDVRRVQEWLTLGGSQTDIDGDFGPATEAAVRAFQRGRGLPESGAVGERTWAALSAPMRAALAPVVVAADDSIHDAVLVVARAHLAVHPGELRVRGQRNCGPWVRLYMHGREGDDQPWGGGFVCHVIAQAAHALGEAGPPIPRRVRVDALVRDAKEGGRFLDGGRWMAMRGSRGSHPARYSSCEGPGRTGPTSAS